MTVWDIGWDGRHRHDAKSRSDEGNSGSKIARAGGAKHSGRALLERATAVRMRRALEIQRSELPRGGDSLAARVGAELRAVFSVGQMTHELDGLDDLLERLECACEVAEK
jgi:hypothetical protein